ncbi:DUF3857 domain-containing protein [bacterium]|nr:DUF3857 domain-containing protein [bacterium]
MKRIKIIAIVLVLLAAAAAGAQTMGRSGGHDLDSLWSRAQKAFDLAQEDAVLLLEGRNVTVGQDGSLATRVHRVVWIGTSVGIREYADLRVPWNSATSDLDVEILRTWRDGRWWPDPEVISETAVVHTLPHALDRADDYTTMRETMLLHDGVELPCIMETAYTITERGGARPGCDAVFVMPQRDPAVLVEYTLDVEGDTPLKTASYNGAPEAGPTEISPPRSLRWTIDDVPALKMPLTGQPELYEPTLQWSTWSGGSAFLEAWSGAIEPAAEISSALQDSLARRLLPVEGFRATVQAILDFAGEAVRPVHYDDRFWRFSPRSAARTFETGYGHDLDRAVLIKALMESRGITATTVFVTGPGSEPLDLEPAAPRGALFLRLEGSASSGLPLFFDVSGGVLHHTDFQMVHKLTIPGRSAELPPGSTEGTLTIRCAIRPDSEGDWTGAGSLVTGGSFCLNDRVLGTNNRMAEGTQAIVNTVLPGAVVGHANPEWILAGHGAITFDLQVPDPTDPDGRFVIGNPEGGVLDRLPHDVHLYDATRESPVLLESACDQTVSVRFKLDGRTLQHAPRPLKIENSAGSFEVAVTEKDGWVTIERTLAIPQDTIAPENWPALRELLLEEADSANGTVIIGEAE